jgi:hypothetical protein
LGKILTSQLVTGKIKPLQIRQFDDFGDWDWPYINSRQTRKKGDGGELVHHGLI